MNRNWSDKVNAKQLSKALAGLAGLSILTAVFFQNCSPVNVVDMTEEERMLKEHIAYVGAGEVVVSVGASQYDKTSAGFDVGLDSVPPLKQFWIIDNSKTMVYNNLNLSNSFGAMFNQNNQDSLFKFDTTAYLLSTAQAVPSYSSNKKTVVTDIANRQKAFTGIASVKETDFNTVYRTATQNSGHLPGDNVGIWLKAVSATDFSLAAAPVLGKAPGSTFSLSPSIRKPANTNTNDFESEFQSRLAILTSTRIPTYVANGTEYQENADVLDKESGLCALARVLDNPNGLYTSSDLLAFTIVTDENENDVSGANCLKRTAHLSGEVDLVNGRCAEFETPFAYAQRSRDPYTCLVNGQSGYRAEFSFQDIYAAISYYTQTAAESTSYSTPQTKISWSTPTALYEQLQTAVKYYTQKTVPAEYKYELRRIPVSYYTKNCTKQSADGIETTTCVEGSASSGFVDASSYSNCNAAARVLSPNAIIAVNETTPAISSSKLPKCDPAIYQQVPTCNASDTANCKVTLNKAAYLAIDKGPIDKFVVGNQAGNCAAAALSLDANAVTSTSSAIGADKLPVCQAAAWVKVSTCVESATCRINTTGGTPAPASKTVLGAFADGSAGCKSHSVIPSNAIASSISCAAASAKTGSGACPAGEAALGCVATITPATKGMSEKAYVTGVTSIAECDAWVKTQPYNFTDASHPIKCDLFNVTTPVSASRTFVEAGNNSLQVGDSCGATATAFYNSLSATDKAKLGATGASSACKIVAVSNGGTKTRTRTAATCAEQLAADCSAINYRNCSSTQGGGGFTTAYSAATPHSRVKMKDINCNSKCKDLPAGACESWSTQDITFAQYLTNKYGSDDKQIQCSASASVELSPAVDTIRSRPFSDAANFCPTAASGARRYFVQEGATFKEQSDVDEFVAGNSDDGKSPRMDLIQFIKNKIVANNLNVNLSVFIRRSADPDGVSGNGVDYKGVHYENMIQVLSTPGAGGRAPASGQVYSVLAPSYEAALTNLSAELKSKLIRSFTVAGLKSYQVITAVKITAANGSVKNLAIGEWSQSGTVITIANGISLNEGDKVEVQFQNDDGYIRAQLQKEFIIEQMRPDQIVKSVEHIKGDGGTVLLTQDQWLKNGNKIVIDPSVVVNGGDRFRIKFKNNVTED